MNKREQRLKRAQRIRKKIHGSQEKPRLSVFRSNKYFYAQLINDDKMQTVVGVSQTELKTKKIKNRIKCAHQLGVLLAKKAGEKKIKEAVFDRRGYAYHGRVKAFADGAREGGIKI